MSNYKLLFALLFIFINSSLVFSQGELLDDEAFADAKEYNSIEEALKEPLKVYKLNLDDNGLSIVPEEISQLKNLQSIDLWKKHR